MFSRKFLFHVLSSGLQYAFALMCFMAEVVTFVTINIGVHKWSKMIIMSICKLLRCFVAYIVIPSSLVYISTSQIVIFCIVLILW
jgi:hypothetical protein